VAAQMGAQIIKVKLPSDHIEQAKAREVYAKEDIAISTLSERVKHVVQSAFAGKRIVIFSGGVKKDGRLSGKAGRSQWNERYQKY